MARKTKKTETPKTDAEQPEVEVTAEAEAPPQTTETDPPSDDADVVDATDPPEETDATEPTDEPSDAQGELVEADAGADADNSADPEEPGADAEPQDTVLAETVTTDMVDVTPEGEARSDTSDVSSEPEAPQGTAVLASAPPVSEKRGPGFVPLVLGGLVAGAIGYAVPTFLMPPAQPDDSRLVALETQLSALRDSDPADPVDVSGFETALADLAARVDTLEAAGATAPTVAGADLSGADVDISGLEAAISELSDLPGALAALEARIDALPLPVEGLADRVDAVEAELAALVAETEAVESNAVDLAREAARNQLRIAIDSGAPFAEPLSVLGDAPEALAAVAESGVPTARALAADFPEVARVALAEARRVEPVDGNPITAFLRRQTGARSLEPRDGDDADAVLSRAEAAVQGGDVATALDELQALPPEAAAVLADWSQRAQTRVAAEAALQDYFETE